MLLDCTLDELNKLSESRPLVCFCVSRHLEKCASKAENKTWISRISFFVDNNPDIQNKKSHLQGKEFSVYAPDCLSDFSGIVVIASAVPKVVYEVIGQLNSIVDFDNVMIVSLSTMEMHNKYDNSVFLLYPKMAARIPKTIHCFWGGGEKPVEALACVNSWKKYCPDYEIVEWNETNYDFYQNKYVREAYELKKWAFVSDYVRLDVLYRYGGIYMDFDVEMLRALDDLLIFEAFMGFEDSGLINIGSGVGAVKGYPLIKELLDQYEAEAFLGENQVYSSKDILMQPTRQLDVFTRHGYKRNNKTQIIDNVAYLSPDIINVVASLNHNCRYLSGSEYLVHWTRASWYDQEHRMERETTMKYRDMILEMNWKRGIE